MKRTIFLFLTSLLFASASMGLYAWSYQFVSHLREDVFARESGANEQKLRESRADSTRKLFATTVLEREALRKYFVKQDEVAAVVGRLEKLGAESGVSVEVSAIGIGAGTGVTEERVRSVDITVQAVGSRAATSYFLKQVELFPLVLSIKEISLERLAYTESKEERWRLAVNLRIGSVSQ